MHTVIVAFAVRICPLNTFSLECLIHMYLHVFVCLDTFSWKKVSLLMIERCSPVLNFVMLSRFHCPEWLNTCRQDFETFKKHVRSDLGPFESFVNIDTFPEQIAIIELFSKFRKFTYCACLQRAYSPRDIIE